MFYGDKMLSFCRYKMQLSILVLILAQLASMARAYFITVDAHAEECFFDKVKSGTKMGLMFEVAEGGFLDIDVRIVGPDGKTIHQVHERKQTFVYFITSVVLSLTRYFIIYIQRKFRARENLMANTPSLPTWTACTSTASPTRCRP